MARQLIQSMLFNTQPPHNYHNILKKKKTWIGYYVLLLLKCIKQTNRLNVGFLFFFLKYADFSDLYYRVAQ